MKSTSKTKPIFESEIKGAAGSLTDAYNTARPGLEQGAQQFGDIRDTAIDRWKTGDPTVGAARSHYDSVLSGKYLNSNPELQNIIDQTGGDVRNQWQAKLASRGLTGGSDYAGIIARELAKNSSNLRFSDYNNQLGRMDNAAASVGSLVGAENGLLDPAFSAYQAQAAPLIAASDYAQGIGGLLGQYNKTTQKGSVGGLLAGLGGSALSGWASGGFKGI